MRGACRSSPKIISISMGYFINITLGEYLFICRIPSHCKGSSTSNSYSIKLFHILCLSIHNYSSSSLDSFTSTPAKLLVLFFTILKNSFSERGVTHEYTWKEIGIGARAGVQSHVVLVEIFLEVRLVLSFGSIRGKESLGGELGRCGHRIRRRDHFKG